MTKYASINPTAIPGANEPDRNNEFAALVNVKSSRYVKYEYSLDSGIAPRIGIEWVMGTTKGNSFSRTWSIGVPWEGNEGAISADGKHCSVDIKRNSDAYYMLQKVVDAGFPAEKLTNDISVFDTETFFMATDANPRSKGSSRKLYPKKYHSEGWETAREAALQRRAAREAQQNAPAYTPTSSYNPPAVMQTDNKQVLEAAGEILAAVLVGGGPVTRNQLPSKINAYIEQKQKETGSVWDSAFRRDVAIALWDIEQLNTVVAANPRLTISGETINFK